MSIPGCGRLAGNALLRHVALAVLVAALLSGAPLAAQTWSYRDSKGEVRFLDESGQHIAVHLESHEALQSLADELMLAPDALAGWRAGRPLLVAVSPEVGGGRELARGLLRKGKVSACALVFESVDGQPVILDRELIVRLRQPGEDFPEALVRRWGLMPLYPLDAASLTWLVRVESGEQALALTFDLSSETAVEWVVPDFYMPVTLTMKPNDPWYGHQWFHQQDNGQHIHSEAAWDISTGNRDIVVAVIDTGLDMTHPDFDPARLVTGWNAETRVTDPTPGPKALDAHGTQAAGLVAASGNNNEGVIGVCPGCSLMGIRFLDAFTNETQLSRAASAVQWAVDQGADVISCSWEIGPNYIDIVDMRPLYAAVQSAVRDGRAGKGAVVVVAAGNSRREIDPRALANMPEVITVGAVDWTGQWLDYSNTGANLSVVAPSGPYDQREPQIFTTDMSGDEGVSRGGWLYRSSILVDAIKTDKAEPDTTGNYTAYFNGTSAATPMVAGLAGLMLSVNPDLRPAQVRTLLEATADPLPLPARGEPFPETHVGKGRVNAARALAAAPYGTDGAPGAPCAIDANCGIGICDGDTGRCVYACEDDADCPFGYFCDFGNCMTDDMPDGDTPDGDPADGDAPDGDFPDGDASDGDYPDGDGSDGDSQDGDSDWPGWDLPDPDEPPHDGWEPHPDERDQPSADDGEVPGAGGGEGCTHTPDGPVWPGLWIVAALMLIRRLRHPVTG